MGVAVLPTRGRARPEDSFDMFKCALPDQIPIVLGFERLPSALPELALKLWLIVDLG